MLQLDVTKQDQIDRAKTYIIQYLPEKGLWAVVNNAGIANLGFSEWIPFDLYEKVFDVNLKGTIRMAKTFLPLIRKSKGRIVNVSSGAGRMGLLYHGPYVASKFAMEGFSDVLRQEMRPFGVKICVVEPGNYIRCLHLIISYRMLKNKFIIVALRYFEVMLPMIFMAFGRTSMNPFKWNTDRNN